MKCSNFFYFPLLLLVIITSCASTEYERKEREELSKGVRVDSLFMGLRFGMTSKEFFKLSWELNQKHIFRDGVRMTVQYDLADLKHPATMNFYPDFNDDRIYQMPVTISYTAWAPWNKDLFSDKLQMDVLSLLKKWYGNDFMEIRHPEKGVAYVKVDGNRRITLFKQDDSSVKVIYRDLSVE